MSQNSSEHMKASKLKWHVEVSQRPSEETRPFFHKCNGTKLPEASKLKCSNILYIKICL